jgi:hypothetical protein
MSMRKNPRPPHVVHRVAEAEDVLTGGDADCMPLWVPTAEARHLLRLVDDDLLDWEAHPQNRGKAALALEEACDLATTLRRQLIHTLRTCVAAPRNAPRRADRGK